jgi:hypothetical protein
MEHKWFVYFAEPSLFFYRSWTGRATFRLDIETIAGGARVTHAACAADILEDHSGAWLAALVHFLVSNLLLGRSEPFPFPEGFSDPAPGLFQTLLQGQVTFRFRSQTIRTRSVPPSQIAGFESNPDSG